MNNSKSVVKLLNFFVKFRESCKGKHSKHRLIDILTEVFLCDSEDDVFLLYSSISNQVTYAFTYLRDNSDQEEDDIKELEKALKNAINQSRQELYFTISAKNQNPALYPIYLDDNCFKRLRMLASHYKKEADILTQEDMESLVGSIKDLISEIEKKEKLGFEEKLYLVNLLKRISLIIKNYDKLSFDSDLSGDLLSLYANIDSQEILKNDQSIKEKTSHLIKDVGVKIKPDKLKLYGKFKVPSLIDIIKGDIGIEGGFEAEYQNKS